MCHLVVLEKGACARTLVKTAGGNACFSNVQWHRNSERNTENNSKCSHISMGKTTWKPFKNDTEKAIPQKLDKYEILSLFDSKLGPHTGGS